MEDNIWRIKLKTPIFSVFDYVMGYDIVPKFIPSSKLDSYLGMDEDYCEAYLDYSHINCKNTDWDLNIISSSEDTKF